MGSTLSAGPKIRIGSAITLDTKAQNYQLSTQMRNAYHLFFADYIARYGGVLVNGTRHAVELVLVDDAAERLVARWASYVLTDEEDLKYFLGPYSSALSQQQARQVHSRGGVMIAPGASASYVFRNRPGVFGLLPRNEEYSRTVLELLTVQDSGLRKSVYIISETGSSSHRAMAQQTNITVLNDTRVVAGASASRAIGAVLADVMRREPDILLASLKEELCHELVRQAWSIGYSPKAFVLLACPAGEEFIAKAGNAGQYIIHVTPWLPSMMLFGNVTGAWTSQSFANEFASRYGSVPSYQTASAFTAAAVLVHGIETANSLDPVDVRNAVAGMRADSIFGDFTFDGDGQGTVQMKVTQYQMKASPSLIYPCSSCLRALVYPRPDRAVIECQDTGELATRYGFVNGTCVECPAGLESAVANQSGTLLRICRPCAAGMFAPIGLVKRNCVPCPPGFYADAEGMGACRACSHGHFSNSSGSVTCGFCEAGSVAENVGQTQCTMCAKGTYQNATGGSECVRCDEGSFASRDGATSCKRCPFGFTTKGTGFAMPSDCKCPSGTFDPSLLEPNRSRHCEPCPVGVSCPGFGSPMGLKPGYYEQWGAFNPLVGVWKCAVEAACPGGEPSTCSGGLVGVACSSCPEGFANVGGVGCAPCHELSRTLPILVFAVLPLVAVAFFYVERASSTLKETNARLAMTIMARIAFTSLQIMGLFHQLNIRWPSGVAAIFRGSAATIGDAKVFRLDCFAGKSQVGSYTLTCAVPFALVATFVLLCAASRCLPFLSGRRLQPWSIDATFSAVCSVGQMSFIALAASAAISIQCYDHPNGRRSLLHFPTIMCYEGEAHATVVAIAGVVLCFAVLPFVAICFWGVYSAYIHSVKDGYDSRQLKMYRFLIWSYRPAVWWWGVVFNLRQLIIGLTPIVSPEEASLQLEIVMLVLLAYLVSLVFFCPWRSIEINCVDVAASLLLVCTIMAVLPLLPSTSAVARQVHILNTTVSLLIVLLGLSMIYVLANLCCRGSEGRFGVRFPLERSMTAFANTWARMARRVADAGPEENTQLLARMDDFDRLAIDRVMSTLMAAEDQDMTEHWIRQASEFSWVPTFKVLRVTSRSAQRERATRLCDSGNSGGGTATTRDEPTGDDEWRAECERSPAATSGWRRRACQPK